MFAFFHSEISFTQKVYPLSKKRSIVCNTSIENNSKSNNFGGLGKSLEDGAVAKIQECLLVVQDAEYSRFTLANDRIRVLKADAYDISCRYIFDVDAYDI